MAVTLYIGPPGAGKSHALVAELMLPAVMKGRRVATNVDGVDPDKVFEYCAAQIEKEGGSPDDLGEVVTFDGKRATQPGFFPTETIPDTETFIKAGDLVIFDEWGMHWERRGKIRGKGEQEENRELEPFMRWHRHLVSPKGIATDVAIATHRPTDIHQDIKGLIVKLYKFRKLDGLGLSKKYVYRLYEGYSDAKGTPFINGQENYRKEVFPLYSSYSGAKGAAELRTDRRSTIWSKKLIALIVGGVVLFLGGVWYMVNWFTAPAAAAEAQRMASAGANTPGQKMTPAAPAVPWRIIGHVVADDGMRVVVVNDAGAMRLRKPDDFEFDGDRPVSGTVDGQRAEAEQFVLVEPTLVELGGVQQ